MRGPRADARRNRELILQSADRLMRTAGPTIQMDDVARAAGVGVGTLYRHFPTKEALLAELFVPRLEACVAEAEEALAKDDSATAMRTFVVGVAHLMSEDVGLLAALADAASPACEEQRNELTARKEHLVAQAQADGAVRADVGWADFAALVRGMGVAIAAGAAAELAAGVLLDGLRVGRSAVRWCGDRPGMGG